MWWDTGRHPRRQLSLNNESLSYEYKADEMMARKLFICSVPISDHSQLGRTQFLDNLEKWSGYLGFCCASGLCGGLQVCATFSSWRPLVAVYSLEIFGDLVEIECLSSETHSSFSGPRWSTDQWAAAGRILSAGGHFAQIHFNHSPTWLQSWSMCERCEVDQDGQLKW